MRLALVCFATRQISIGGDSAGTASYWTSVSESAAKYRFRASFSCRIESSSQPWRSAARSVLVQAGTTARTTGWTTIPCTFTPKRAQQAVEGEQIVAIGTGPWQIKNTNRKFTLANPNLREAILVDSSGYAMRPVTVDRKAGKLTMAFPPNGLYVVIR